jgi:hypothetical protein
MSGSGRPGRLLKAPGNRRRRGMAVTRGRFALADRTRLTGRLMLTKGARREIHRAPANSAIIPEGRSPLS